MGFGLPSSYQIIGSVILSTINQIIVPYFSFWLVAFLLYVTIFILIYLHYDETFATLYRIFWIWGPTGSFSWIGGVVASHNPYIGILLLFLGVLLGLAFRWAVPPITKYLIWREF